MRLASLIFLLFYAFVALAGPQELKTIDFTELKVSGPLNVDYKQSADSAGFILVDGPTAEQLSWVEASSKGKTLSLKLHIPDEVVNTPRELPAVTVYSSYLTKVENEGDSTVRVLSAASVAEFSAFLLGNGRLSVRNIVAGSVSASQMAGYGIIALGGECNKAALKVTGSGVIQADGLRALDATVWCAGTGNVGVWAVKTLSVKGAGSGTVFLLGTPEVKKHTLGIKLQPIE